MKNLRALMAAAGVMIQILVVLLYSFTDLPIPYYVYLIVWILCVRLFFRVNVV